jgi:hypothetical protein
VNIHELPYRATIAAQILEHFRRDRVDRSNRRARRAPSERTITLLFILFYFYHFELKLFVHYLA